MPPVRSAKRSRVSRACDQCRIAREKCDGTQPACSTCLGATRSCTYTAAPKKRGIQPGYIRTLELALIWLFQHDPELEDQLQKKLAKEGASSVLLSRDSPESNKLHERWRNTKFCKSIDKGLSGESISPSDDVSALNDEDQNNTNDEPANQQSQIGLMLSPSETPSSNVFLLSGAELATQEPQEACAPPEPLEPHPTHLPESSPLPLESLRLLDVYCAYTQPWLPICEKSDLLRTLYSYPEEGVSLKTSLTLSGYHAELWSVLAVAAHQARLDQIDITSLSDARRLYGIARTLIPDELGSFSAGHTKALLNLAVINIGQGKMKAAWILVGCACRLINLVKQSQGFNSRWNHIVAGCFLLENLLSIPLNDRPYLRGSDITALEEDGLEEWQPWSSPLKSSPTLLSRTPVLAMSSFNKLAEILDILTSLGSDLEQSTVRVLPRITAWKTSLSANLNYISEKAGAVPENPPALLLQMAYSTSLFKLDQSTEHIKSMLRLLEHFQAQLSIAAIPPVTLCLIEGVQMDSAYLAVEQHTRDRLREIVKSIKRFWGAESHDIPIATPSHPQMQPRSYVLDQVPTPGSSRLPLSVHTLRSNRMLNAQHRATTSLLEDLLPDKNPTTPAINASTSLAIKPATLGIEPRRNEQQSQEEPTASHDLEKVFDELASLDGVESIENRQQFMRNLGFAPDANLVDFVDAESSQTSPSSPTSSTSHHTPDHLQLHGEYFGAM